MHSKKRSIFLNFLPILIFSPEKSHYRLTIYAIVLNLLLRPTYGIDDEVVDVQTVHESAGQPHFPEPEYSSYASNPIYTKEPHWTYLGMTPIHIFTNFLFKHLYGFDKNQPPGYISDEQDNSTALGSKVIRNEWKDLLSSNKAVILWIMLLLFLIIVIPFMAICYFCFCLCLCPHTCPPCEERELHKKRLIFSILLGLLMLGILFGLIVAFLNDKLIDRGFRENGNTLRRGAADTCVYLKDVCDHVYHLFVFNFEELQTHLKDRLEDAHTHIFMDLADTSGASALVELESILRDLPLALKELEQVDWHQKVMRFYGSTFRDSLRGVKRDLNYILTVWCDNYFCNRMLFNEGFLHMDTSKCLHFDKLPDTALFVENAKEIISKHLDPITTKGIKNLKKIDTMIQNAVQPVIPVMLNRLATINFELRNEAFEICNITKTIMSETYLNSLRSSKIFEDVYYTYGTDRRVVSNVACFLIFMILVLLTFALIFGCCVRKNNAGSHCILMAMLIIFCVFSFILLVSLFYFMLGWVLYAGSCVDRSNQEKSDNYLKLNRGVQNRDMEPNGTHMLSDFQACRSDQYIFDFLRNSGIFDINKLSNMKSFGFQSESIVLNSSLGNIEILTTDEFNDLNDLRTGNLSIYHSRLYTENLCKNLAPQDIRGKVRGVYNSLWSLYHEPYNPPVNPLYPWKEKYYFAVVNLYRLTRDVANYERYRNYVTGRMNKIENLLTNTDKYITKNDLTFGDTIGELLDRVKKAEKFIRESGNDIINQLCLNLTNSVEEDVSKFIQKLIAKSKADVGPCKPLAYINSREIDWTCKHVVNPINGFWFGLIICALLFLPLLFVAHRLLCLFKIIAKPHGVVYLSGGGFPCPTCTGTPYVSSPTLVSSEGQQTTCPCSPINQESEASQMSNQDQIIKKTKTD